MSLLSIHECVYKQIHCILFEGQYDQLFPDFSAGCKCKCPYINHIYKGEEVLV